MSCYDLIWPFVALRLQTKNESFHNPLLKLLFFLQKTTAGTFSLQLSKNEFVNVFFHILEMVFLLENCPSLVYVER